MQETLTLNERLANYIVEGTKQGLHEDLSLALEEGRKPLDIINGAYDRDGRGRTTI